MLALKTYYKHRANICSGQCVQYGPAVRTMAGWGRSVFNLAIMPTSCCTAELFSHDAHSDARRGILLAGPFPDATPVGVSNSFKMQPGDIVEAVPEPLGLRGLAAPIIGAHPFPCCPGNRRQYRWPSMCHGVQPPRRRNAALSRYRGRAIIRMIAVAQNAGRYDQIGRYFFATLNVKI